MNLHKHLLAISVLAFGLAGVCDVQAQMDFVIHQVPIISQYEQSSTGESNDDRDGPRNNQQFWPRPR